MSTETKKKDLTIVHCDDIGRDWNQHILCNRNHTNHGQIGEYRFLGGSMYCDNFPDKCSRQYGSVFYHAEYHLYDV